MTQQERSEQIALMIGYEISENKECFKLPHKNGWIILEIFRSDWNWLHKGIQFLHKHFESKEWSWTTIERYPLYSEIEEVFIVVSDFAKLYNNKEL
jgi:hypothetical protein